MRFGEASGQSPGQQSELRELIDRRRGRGRLRVYVMCEERKRCKACDKKGSAASDARDGLRRVERGREREIREGEDEMESMYPTGSRKKREKEEKKKVERGIQEGKIYKRNDGTEREAKNQSG